ncbi:coiled-coil domain-containing protein 186 [Bradysia coprophila]|uniref:coiled-coil domain-containing protein 186 n=1 Tax=Bradysia coprophila TaxID=38358 RepID=UPI00187D96FA|nr:coiled-coil domain-containing protein 186 [Bradysia coprophila]
MERTQSTEFAENIDFTINGETDTATVINSSIETNCNNNTKVKSNQPVNVVPELEQTSQPDDETYDEHQSLNESLENIKKQTLQFESILTQKENVINLQRRELEVVEKEKSALKRELDASRKDKESAVVRYAMVEKNIIDLRNSNDVTNRRLRELQKEVESLTARLKFVNNEKERAGKDLKKSYNECEGLKNELINVESKFKLNQTKMKQDSAAKAALEIRVNELTQQLAQLTENRQQCLDIVRSEEKETEAQVILLKHSCEEKEKEKNSLMTKVVQLTANLDDVRQKLERVSTDHEKLLTDNAVNVEKLQQYEQVNAEQSREIELLTVKLAEAEIWLEDQQKIIENNQNVLTEMAEIKENFQEQMIEIDKVRLKEESLLTFIKDLTEKSVELENKLLLSNSKASALVLENEKIKKVYDDHRQILIELEEEIVICRQKHKEELDEMNELIHSQKRDNESLREKLDYALGDLDATKRKHSQIVKELNREVTSLHEKLDPKYREVLNQSARDEVKEPSKKALIDRIVKLQRILARQTEKIEFLENHCAALINELKSKS